LPATGWRSERWERWSQRMGFSAAEIRGHLYSNQGVRHSGERPGNTSERTPIIRITWSAIDLPALKVDRYAPSSAGMAKWSRARGRRLPPIATKAVRRPCGQRRALTWVALSAGTMRSARGTARAMARDSSRTARSYQVLRSLRRRRSN